MQGFLTIQIINPNENFVFMVNRNKAPVKGIDTCLLILHIGHHLDLFQTIYVPTIFSNLVSSLKFDVVQFPSKFSFASFSLFKNSTLTGTEIFL